MNIYLITQTENTGYETYDGAVVVAANTEQAQKLHPSGFERTAFNDREWTTPDKVIVKQIGTAVFALNMDVPCVLLSSYNAG